VSSTKWWIVDVSISEYESRRSTRAEVWLRIDPGTELRGVGVARRNPRDAEVPDIGDKLAAARALVDLARELREAAAREIQEATHQPTRLPV
jgi:uncharacterized protein DUF1876